MDITYLLFLQKLRIATHGVFDDFATQISNFASTMTAMFIICLVYWCLNKSKGKIILLSFVFSNFLARLIKLQFCVYRPFVRCNLLQPLDHPFEYSMPSGHAAYGTGLYLSIANQFSEIPTIKYVCFALIPLIMFSRNWLGAHTPQDVLCGFLIGAVACVCAAKLSKKIEKRKNLDWMLLVVSIVLAYFVISYMLTKTYPMLTDATGKLWVNPLKEQKNAFRAFGLLIGYLSGITLEKRFVNFVVPEKLSKKLSVLFLGYLILLFIHSVVPDVLKLFFAKNVGVFIRDFVDVFYITFLFPIIIKKHFN
ncbi:MAG: phosphatase PAP2 family protein [Synergistaceae bacterium]|nr:phosphatase PAP2 family protein [Synergistaceae bacterium]